MLLLLRGLSIRASHRCVVLLEVLQLLLGDELTTHLSITDWLTRHRPTCRELLLILVYLIWQLSVIKHHLRGSSKLFLLGTWLVLVILISISLRLIAHRSNWRTLRKSVETSRLRTCDV